METPTLKIAGSLRGSDGKDGNDGYTPVKGVDYFTEEDKQEIVDAVVTQISDSLPLSTEGVEFG